MAAASGTTTILEMTNQLHTLITNWGDLQGTMSRDKHIQGLVRRGNELIQAGQTADSEELHTLSSKAQKKADSFFDLAGGFQIRFHELADHLFSVQKELDPPVFSIFKRHLGIINGAVKEHLDPALVALSHMQLSIEGLYPVGFYKESEPENSQTDLLKPPSSPEAFVAQNNEEEINQGGSASEREEIQESASSNSLGETEDSDIEDINAEIHSDIEDGSSINDEGSSCNPTDDESLAASSSHPQPQVQAPEENLETAARETFDLPKALLNEFKDQTLESILKASLDLKEFDDSKLSSFVSEDAANEFYIFLAQQCGIEGDPDTQEGFDALAEWGENHYAQEENKSMSILEHILIALHPEEAVSE